jgi:heterodisulfide reductase subunit A2
MSKRLDAIDQAAVQNPAAGQRIGVYFCQTNDAAEARLNLPALVEYAAGLHGVCTVKLMPAGRTIDPDALGREIRSAGLNAVVVAGNTPGYFKSAFSRALVQAGQDAQGVRLSSFREHGVRDEASALDRAKAVLACAVYNVPFGLAAQSKTVPVASPTLVIGGGIAGIQAALEIADAGHKVYLVERQGTIGGHMAMFDKTFPTLDCAACILTPKMVAAGQHPNIELLMLSEVQDVTGHPGKYNVKVLKRATRVDAAACVACNDCSQFCPTTVSSEFDVGTGTRKAIYIPFPQAVPNAYMVDAAACTWVQSGGKKCGVCVKKCSKGAVHLDAKDEVVEFEVGNIILATGYEPLDARQIERYGYGKHPNVLTVLEFERLLNSSGPTGGKIVLKTKKLNKKTKAEEWVFDPEGPAPKSVAIIHCVGSRDVHHNNYCSRVCCMYSLKFAHLVREKLPDATCYQYYIDMRAFGKGYEDFLERVKDEGVHQVRGRSARVEALGDGLVVRGEDIVADRVVELPVDMVLLAVGLRPAPGAEKLAQMLGVDIVRDGWFDELNYNMDPNSTEQGGVFVAGVCQGPKDIPDTVAQASAVAARVLRTIVSGKARAGRASLTLEEIEKKASALAQS